MRLLRQSRLIQALVLLNLIVGVAYFGSKIVYTTAAYQESARVKSPTSISALADDLDKRGIENKADFYTGRSILGNAYRNKSITDQEASWIIAHLQDTAPSSSGLLSAEMVVDEIQSFSPTQKIQLLDVCSGVIASPSRTSAGLWRKQIACSILAKLGDRKAVPVLLPLLDGPADRTQRRAREALRALGYAPTASPAPPEKAIKI